MKVRVDGGRTLHLRPREFVAEGGEGRVWARRGTAYKVYRDRGRALPPDKLAALRSIDSADVVTPDRLLLDPSSRAPVGYTMRFIPGAWSVTQLFARSFCDRHGLGIAELVGLVQRIRDAIEACHRRQIVLVDLSGANILVCPHTHAPALIDCDSWQTPGHPATASTAATRDPKTLSAPFSPASDWFSFAVVTFQLLTGLHPFRGKHPVVRGLTARMAAGLSVLDPAVTVPAASRPLSVIPPVYRRWYETIFVRDERTAPPTSTEARPIHAVGRRSLPRPARSDAPGPLHCEVLTETPAPIRQVLPVPGRASVVILTSTAVHSPGGAPVAVDGAGVLGTLDSTHGWVHVAGAGNDALTVTTRTSDGTTVRSRLHLTVEALAPSGDGRILALSSGTVLQLQPLRVGKTIRLVPRTLARGTPLATFLGRGVVISRALGTTRAIVLAGRGTAHGRTVAALQGTRVLDAKYERGVLIATARTTGDRRPRLRRITVQYTPDFGRARVTIDDDIDDPTVDFVVTDAGRCVARAGGDRLVVFAADPDHAGRSRRVDARALGPAHLARAGDGTVLAVSGTRLSRLRLRAATRSRAPSVATARTT